MARRRVEGWITPLWLAHHYPDGYDRCVRIGRSHVCRRCLVLYPLAVAVLLVGLAIGAPAASPLDGMLTAVLLVALPIPAVIEWTLEHSGVVAYSPRRQVLVSVPLGLGLGAGFVRYLDNLTDPLFWGVVVVYGGYCAAIALLLARRVGPGNADPDGQ